MIRLSALNIKEVYRKGKWKSSDPELTGVETSSLRIENGHIFVAKPGITKNSHGATFSNQAFKKGASLIISDLEGYQYALTNDLNPDVPFLLVENLVGTLDNICEKFYPEKPEFVMGITGTNGKTSVVNFSQQLIEQKNKSCITVGTLGVGGVINLRTQNTTPDQPFIYRILQMAKQKGANYALLEVSSHAIEQRRINGVAFNVFCFTNLSQDHLDYHKDMGTYFQSKLNILDILSLDTKIIVNIDHEYGKLFFAKAKNVGFKIETIGFSNIANVKLRVHQDTSDTQSVEIIKGGMSYRFRTNLIGKFQVLNLGMALLTCETIGFEFAELTNYCKFLKPVPGRLEFVGKTKLGASIYIDFAHTPDGLEHLLKTLRALAKGELILVFGAGGERDKDKRKPMGAIANRYCDLIFVTDDNPRHEDAAFIRKQIIQGCPSAIEVGDRSEAIAMAINKASFNDIVIIAGKGHEKEQVVKDNCFPFSDFEQASTAIELMEQNLSG